MSEKKPDDEEKPQGTLPNPPHTQGSRWATMALYAVLAFIPTFLLDLKNLDGELGELSVKGWMLLLGAATYQGLLAIKAYISQGWRNGKQQGGENDEPPRKT